MADDRRLTAAVQRAAHPEKTFSDIWAELEMGGPTERAAGAEHFRMRANAAFELYGLNAPGIASHESLTDYRRKLLTHLAPYSDQLRHVDFRHMSRETLPPFEKIAVDDAVALFESDVGPERSTVRADATGRLTRHFFGEPTQFWQPFRNPERRGFISRVLGRGKDSDVARAARARDAAALKAGYAALAAHAQV